MEAGEQTAAFVKSTESAKIIKLIKLNERRRIRLTWMEVGIFFNESSERTMAVTNVADTISFLRWMVESKWSHSLMWLLTIKDHQD